MKGKSSDDFLCICGIIVDSSNLINLNNDIAKFKTECGFENLKEFRSRKIPTKSKIGLTSDLFEVLEANDAKVISVILGEPTLKRIRDKYKRHHKEVRTRFAALTFLVERFYLHLKRTKQTGQVVSDSLNPKVQSLLQDVYYDYITKSKFQMYFREGDIYKDVILPSISFTKDEHSDILQCSDLIAYSLNGAISRTLNEIESVYKLNVENLEDKNPFISIYWALFEKDYSGNVKGWGIKLWH